MHHDWLVEESSSSTIREYARQKMHKLNNLMLLKERHGRTGREIGLFVALMILGIFTLVGGLFAFIPAIGNFSTTLPDVIPGLVTQTQSHLYTNTYVAGTLTSSTLTTGGAVLLGFTLFALFLTVVISALWIWVTKHESDTNALVQAENENEADIQAVLISYEMITKAIKHEMQDIDLIKKELAKK